MTTNLARHVSRARAERLVAHARLAAYGTAILAAAVTADTFALLVTVPWTIVSAILVWGVRRDGRLAPLPLLLVCDLLIAGCLIAMTGGGASPFFPYLLVAAFAASVLYGRRGMIWSAAGAVTVYVVTSLVTASLGLDLRTFVIRLGVLIVVWSIITRRADHEARTTADLEQLASWPRIVKGSRANGVHELLAHASATLRSTRVALEWEEVDGASFLARYDSGDGAFTLEDDVLDGATLAAPIRTQFASQTASGWLMALDPKTGDEDDRRLAEIVARLVSSGLDQINVLEIQRERAAADERLRLSRDLHDGLLQSLGAMALHTQTARRVIATNPHAAEERLDFVVEQLAEGQRSLRELVDHLRPELCLRREPLHARLGRLARTIALQWNVDVHLDAEPSIDQVEGRLAEEIVALVAEALANAARHARAKRIDGTVSVHDGVVLIDVTDDGQGFPFHGRHELAQLVATAEGPWSLKERVIALGGGLAIDSSPRGSRVEVRLPRSAAS
jgi:signal transduction histidine kinase